MKITPVILCGGGGTRLWPLSTPLKPKQFLNLAGDRSMLEETALRVSDPGRFNKPFAIGSVRHQRLLKDALPTATILLEPVGRNSAPPIAAACLLTDPEDLLLVLPADHYIKDVPAFLSAIEKGQETALEGQIVTFGIEPSYPATGYGYIESEGAGPVRPVVKFVEKPDFQTAQHYMQTGRFFWNAGIFLFRASVMIDAFKAHAPDILNDVREALTETELDRAAFQSVRSQSIDYAVLEHASNISVVPVSMGWSDLGDFRALHEANCKDEERNVHIVGQAVATDSRDAYIRVEGLRAAVHGMSDIAVIASHDNILVTQLSDAAGIKQATSNLANIRTSRIHPDQKSWLQAWLWSQVLPGWADRAVDDNGGLIENLDLDGQAILDSDRRGRIAPRQLFTFARAKRLKWNPAGAVDRVIDAAIEFLNTQGRASGHGWVHSFNSDSTVLDSSRDFYDHTFIALAGSELAAIGDKRGNDLADEAFKTIDRLFKDPANEGWHDPETAPGLKRANPHMHLLEASIAHYEVFHDAASLNRIEQIAILFEKWMFDPSSGAVIEDFKADWSPLGTKRVEPGHCYEWAFLLYEVQKLTGRDTSSWSHRLIQYAERHGLHDGLAIDVIEQIPVSYRLWPQLERLRTLSIIPYPGVDLEQIMGQIVELYLKPGPEHGWVDKLDHQKNPDVTAIPASMLYHLMTAIAPFAPLSK